MVRLGLLIPAPNTVIEPEFNKMLPKGFTVHSARLKCGALATPNEIAEMEESTEEEAAKLAVAEVDVIGYGCTSGSFIRGIGHDKEIERKIERISGKPGVSTSGAVVKALRSLKIKKVAVATPYPAFYNERLEVFLKGNGFNISDLRGLALKGALDIGRAESETVIKLVNSLKHKDADGIFISCTNFPTIEVIKKLEDELQKPVVSSNTAILWTMLKKINVPAKIQGYGELLEQEL